MFNQRTLENPRGSYVEPAAWKGDSVVALPVISEEVLRSLLVSAEASNSLSFGMLIDRAMRFTEPHEENEIVNEVVLFDVSLVMNEEFRRAAFESYVRNVEQPIELPTKDDQRAGTLVLVSTTKLLQTLIELEKIGTIDSLVYLPALDVVAARVCAGRTR